MGQAFSWVNVDKKEYIEGIDFGWGYKFIETAYKNNPLLLALYDLLSDEWKGDGIIWLGEYVDVFDQSGNCTLQELYNQAVDYGSTTFVGQGLVWNTYRNVAGLFKDAEEEVRQEVGFYLEDLADGREDLVNTYGVDKDHPFDGLFQKTGRRVRYIINHTKRVYYSLDDTHISDQDNKNRDYMDPLPILMMYGAFDDPGIWLGDVIGVGDDIPEGYEYLEHIVLEW